MTVTLTKLDGRHFPFRCCDREYRDARELMDHLLDPSHP